LALAIPGYLNQVAGFPKRNIAVEGQKRTKKVKKVKRAMSRLLQPEKIMGTQRCIPVLQRLLVP